MYKNLNAQTSNGKMTLYIYGDVGLDSLGNGISGGMVQSEIGNFRGSEINVKINSPGGDAFDGIAIYNLLRRHGAHIVVDVDSLAASAASIIAMAGDQIRIAQSAIIMVHNSWSITVGNRADHQRMVGVLDKIDRSIADIYVARTGLGLAAIQRMMADETWFSANEAISKGFADRISQELKTPAARIAAGRFSKTPALLVDSSKPLGADAERQYRMDRIIADFCSDSVAREAAFDRTQAHIASLVNSMKA